MSIETPNREQMRTFFLDTQRLLMHQLDNAVQDGNAELIASIAETGLESVGRSPSGRHFYTAFLDVANLMLYEKTWSTEELRTGICALNHSISTIDNNILPATVLQVKLSNKLMDRYKRTGQVDDLDVAISWLEWRLQTLPEDHVHRIVWLCRIALALQQRHSRTHSPEDISMAVAFSECALDPIFGEHPDFPYALVLKYRLLLATGTEEGDDLEEAFVQAQTAASSLSLQSDVNDSLWVARLSWLENQYERFGRPEFLNEALSLAEHGMAVFTEDPSLHADWLARTASVLKRRFDTHQSILDLDKAIEFLGQSILMTGEDCPSYPSRLSDAVAVLQERYMRTGNIDDLDLAVAYANQSARSTHRLEPDKESLWLRQMVRILITRHDRTQNFEDLDLALRKAKEALSIKSQSAHDIQDCQVLLLHIYSARFSRTRNAEDLDQALAYSALLISESPDPGQIKTGILHDIAIVWVGIYSATNDVTDLNIPEKLTRMELSVACVGSRLWINASCTLAIVLTGRYCGTGDEKVLEEAMEHCRNALHATEPDSPRRSDLLNLAARTFGLWYNIHRDPRFLKECAEMLLLAMKLPSTPLRRINSGRIAIWLFSVVLGDLEKADTAVEETLRLLPQFCGQHLNRHDQKYVVEEFQGIIAFGCALSLHKGDICQALQRVEFGRGIILGHLIDSRSDLSQLKEQHAELAEEYVTLQDRISVDVNKLPPAIQDEISLDRQIAAKQFSKLEEKIRELPGFEGFNKNASIQQLQDCAADGYIVVVNVAHIRADAIIVSKDHVEAVPLNIDDFKSPDAPRSIRDHLLPSDIGDMGMPQTRLDVGTSHLEPFLTEDFLQSDRKETEQTIKSNNNLRNAALDQDDDGSDDMEWLWVSCVEPVLRRLPPSKDLPRVWWIGCGYATLLPFHAAGRFEDGTFVGCMDKTIPSYTTTIKSLRYARSRSMGTNRSHSRKPSLLLATMPSTPGHSPLLGVEDEIKAVEGSAKVAMDIAHLKQPSANEVLEKIGQCDIAHFACHGVSDDSDPSKSHILLQQKDQSGHFIECVDKLEVSALLDVVKKDRAGIAYLSACSTAESKSGFLRDEGLHLCSAFQIAGFSHVLGSFWPVRDEACATVAGLFYRNLTRNGVTQLTDRVVAESLRNAVLELRQDCHFDVRTWAPFVHFGP